MQDTELNTFTLISTLPPQLASWSPWCLTYFDLSLADYYMWIYRNHSPVLCHLRLAAKGNLLHFTLDVTEKTI